MKISTFKRALTVLAAAALALCVASASMARQGGTTRYVYDENGRLHAVITPSGEAVVYEYDAAGNLTAVRRLAADALAVFAFSPRAGIYGDLVTFIGSGFGGGVSDVSFNGTSAQIVEVTPSAVVAKVPEGATTGPVTITTPRGSVTTAEPFTVAGVVLAPASVILKFGETAQFTAEVLPSTLDQTITWSVNGVEGGNSSVGTISAGGLYTAPDRELPSVTVRATSAADQQRFAEAFVRVRNPEDVQGVFAASVSVSRGANPVSAASAPSVSVQLGNASDTQRAYSPQVSVRFGDSFVANTALAASVAVQKGESSQPTALSADVSVQKGELDQPTALSAGVSVRKDDTTQATAYTNPPVAVRYGSGGEDVALSRPVTVTTGPFIQSVSPAQVTRGTTVTVTLTGANLGGATALRFINESGADDTSITVSGLSAGPDGTTLTATFAVGSGATLGRRIIVVVTPDGSSQFVDIGTNVVVVIAP